MRWFMCPSSSRCSYELEKFQKEEHFIWNIETFCPSFNFQQTLLFLKSKAVDDDSYFKSLLKYDVVKFT